MYKIGDKVAVNCIVNNKFLFGMAEIINIDDTKAIIKINYNEYTIPLKGIHSKIS